MLSKRGELERGPHVIGGQFREVAHDLVATHARGQVLEHVVHRDPGPNEARLSAAHVRAHIDEGHQIHDSMVDANRGRMRRPAADCGFR